MWLRMWLRMFTSLSCNRVKGLIIRRGRRRQLLLYAKLPVQGFKMSSNTRPMIKASPESIDLPPPRTYLAGITIPFRETHVATTVLFLKEQAGLSPLVRMRHYGVPRIHLAQPKRHDLVAQCRLDLAADNRAAAPLFSRTHVWILYVVTLSRWRCIGFQSLGRRADSMQTRNSSRFKGACMPISSKSIPTVWCWSGLSFPNTRSVGSMRMTSHVTEITWPTL